MQNIEMLIMQFKITIKGNQCLISRKSIYQQTHHPKNRLRIVYQIVWYGHWKVAEIFHFLPINPQ